MAHWDLNVPNQINVQLAVKLVVNRKILTLGSHVNSIIWPGNLYPQFAKVLGADPVKYVVAKATLLTVATRNMNTRNSHTLWLFVTVKISINICVPQLSIYNPPFSEPGSQSACLIIRYPYPTTGLPRMPSYRQWQSTPCVTYKYSGQLKIRAQGTIEDAEACAWANDLPWGSIGPLN